MQLQDLSVFKQLYELRSINRVAQTMGFAQSNITVRLQVLESEFGAQLFTRSAQGITPTANGERFYKYAQQVLHETASVKAQMQAVKPGRKVAISELLFNYLVIAKQQMTLADGDFQIVGSSALLQHTPDVDEVVTYANFNDDRYLQFQTQYLPAGVLAAPTVDVRSLPFLINKDKACPFRARTLRMLRPGQDVLEIDSWASIIALTQSGRGVALLPLYLADENQLEQVMVNRRFRVPYKYYQRRGE